MNNNGQLFAEERKSAILDLLKENTKLTVINLCENFKVSPATIRNDLRELENNGLLKRTHGGVISNQKARYEQKSNQKEIKFLDEKNAIAKLAAQLVEDGDTIAIDTGTTTLEFAKQLSSKKHLTVVTNDIEIARYLENFTDASIILTGGLVRNGFHCSVGPIAISSISQLFVDKAFMGTNGITIDEGLTTPDINQAEIKKAMIDIASEIIVLCDNSKFGYKAFAKVVPISSINRIVTDEGIDYRILKELKEKDILVDIASN